jgi:hypothetical protein
MAALRAAGPSIHEFLSEGKNKLVDVPAKPEHDERARHKARHDGEEASRPTKRYMAFSLWLP